VAARVAEALECPVAIAIPAHGAPVVSPPGSLAGDAVTAIAAHAATAAAAATAATAATAAADESGPALPSTVPGLIAEAVPVRIGDQVVGIVAATVLGASPSSSPERRAWLEAAAAAASVTALIRDAPGGNAAELLVAQLAARAPDDVPAVVALARRLGVDLSAGAMALSARGAAVSAAAARGAELLVAEIEPGHVIALGPVTAAGEMASLAGALREAEVTVAVSAPRRDPALVHEAIREAELLTELGEARDASPGGHDETYRLLIGVLLRDRAELAQLRDSTVASLADYDDGHDTELLATLRAFLAHDGSTTETAEAMRLHRHTVGYRLSRVHEVSGLSPYESDGRERLGLGLKAHQILDAEARLAPRP
jgi:hypothetical protein